MKKSFVAFLLLTCLASNSFGSPLVFKAVKEIESTDLIELGSFDATKYKQIRIGIRALSTNKIVNESKYTELIQKRAELTAKLENFKTIRRLTDKNPDVIATQNEIKKINDEITELNNLKSKTLNVSILGVEGKDEIILFSFEEANINRSIVIDSPPSKISVKVSGKAYYALYVWG